MNTKGLQQTVSIQPRADFNKEDYTTLIEQKGRQVLFEKALLCPCKSKSTNQQSDCKNCGGTGWVYVNPKKTRMVISAIKVVTEYRSWSQETRGMANCSALDCDELSDMDKLTILDGISYFKEVCFFRQDPDNLGTWFTFTNYPIKAMRYCGRYVDNNTKFTELVEGTDFTISGKTITLLTNLPTSDDQVSITIRYVYSPAFVVIDIGRETMQSFEYSNGTEKLISLPISAIIRRTHVEFPELNKAGNNILDNNFIEAPLIINTCM